MPGLRSLILDILVSNITRERQEMDARTVQESRRNVATFSGGG